MTRFLHRLSRFGRRNSRLFNILCNLAHHPGASIAGSALLDVQGTLVRHGRVAIGEACHLLVAPGTRLVLGEDCWLGRDVELQPGQAIEIGAGTSLQDRCKVIGDVAIGSRCLFAPNVYVSSGRHWHDFEPSLFIKDQDAMVAALPAPEAGIGSHPVNIEDDCWIGINAVLMRGITVGKGAVVGANSVVTHDVAPYTVVAGAPARRVGQRLEFVPPATITFDSPGDLPYFHSGFRCSLAQLEQDRGLEGMTAAAGFVLSLRAAGSSTISLLARMEHDGSGATLSLDGKQQSVSAQWRQLDFPAVPTAPDRFRFVLQSPPGMGRIIVKRSWVS